MTRSFCIACIFMPLLSAAQLSENFDDGDLTTGTVWTGDLAKFTVPGGQLQSNSTIVSDAFQIATSSTAALDVEWEFWVNMKFSTSSANYTDFYLMADGADAIGGVNGYFVRVGNTKDEVSLYRSDAGSQVLLIDGQDNKTHNKQIRVKVTRDAAGLFDLSVDYTGSTAFASEGSATDLTYTTSSNFILFIRQSSASFHLKHFYDDFYAGAVRVDNTPPEVVSQRFVSPSQIELNFNETTQGNTPAKFSLSSGIGNPSSVSPAGTTILLDYPSPIANGTYTLKLLGIEDTLANQLDTSLVLSLAVYRSPLNGEVVFNEIFADPSPPVSLPGEEYIELYNTSGDTLNLKECTYSDGGSPAVFPNILLAPNEYLTVCKAGNESLFTVFGSTIGLSGFPTLNNTGDALVLSDSMGVVIDSVTYTDDFYKDEDKENGGYSLERIAITSPCPPFNNWTASNDASGGTPGAKNSVDGIQVDQDPPAVTALFINASNEITLNLDEDLDDALAAQLSNFTIVQSGDNPTTIVRIGMGSYLLNFPNTFDPSTIYTLEITTIADCSGNSVSNSNFDVVLPANAEAGDLIFNEILFNPPSNTSDFIELYNTSDKYIDLSTLRIGRMKDGLLDDISTFSSTSIILKPSEYALLTEDTASIVTAYPNTRKFALVEADDLPPMNNDNDTLLLLNLALETLDSLPYSEKQHFDLLRSVDGVSLERISFNGKSYNSSLWHSASASEGYATPGYQNSQFKDISTNDLQFNLASKRMSPDGDGYEDQLVLQYTLDNAGYAINGYVYTLNGTLVTQAFNNISLGSEGVITWDGLTEDRSKTPIGNYVLLLEAFNLEGKIVKKKLAFSVVSNF